MAIIKPISDLRNKSSEISKLVHESHEPVFITKNGEGDMVLLSIEEYRKMLLEREMMMKLAVAEQQYSSGEKGRDADEVIKRLRNKYKLKD